MSMRKIIAAAGAGIVAGYCARQIQEDYQKVNPEKALNNAKDIFKQNGPISGSWIYMKPEEVERNGLTYTAYRGGITRNIDSENKQYEFYVDRQTGAVIDAVQT